MWGTREDRLFDDVVFGDFESQRDAIEFLTDDHREIEDLFEEIARTTAKTRAKHIKAVCDRLMTHAKLEEKHIYPLVKKLDAQMYFEAHEEHEVATNLIRRINKTSGNSVSLDAKLKLLKETIQHHIVQEEANLFPKIKQHVEQSHLNEIGKKMEHAVAAKDKTQKKTNKKKSRAMAN